jgi:hypothetical protein
MHAEHRAVARQRILPRLEPRRADVRRHEVHVAHAAPVVLEGRDLPRVGRPGEDRAVAVHPAGVVGRVAEVLRAVGRQLRLGAAGHVAHPDVVVADERGALAVGRARLGCPAAAPARRPRRRLGRRAARRLGRAVHLRASARIDQHQHRRPARAAHPVGEARVVEPGRRLGHAGDQRRGARREEPLGARVVLGGEGTGRLGQPRRRGDEQEEGDGTRTHRKREGDGREGARGKRSPRRKGAPHGCTPEGGRRSCGAAGRWLGTGKDGQDDRMTG